MTNKRDDSDWVFIPDSAQHPEDQILKIVREKKEIPLQMLPKHLKRTSLWTHDLERQGLIKRVALRGKNGVPAILLVATDTLFSMQDPR